MHGLKNLTGCSVGDRLLLSRAIALIALLRKVDESVPLDAICVYLDEVDCSGLRSILLSADQIKRIDPNATDSYRDYGLRSWRVFGQDAQVVMPEAVVKMVKEYIARVWWDHASSLSDYGWPTQHYSDSLSGCYGGGYVHSDIHLRVYPQYIITALNAFNPIGDTLAEMSDAITALLTVLRSNMPTEYVAEYDCKLEEKRQACTATPLTNRHITKLNQLRYALINAFDRPSAGSVMPDPVTKDLILNAIEVMTLLFPPGDMPVQKALRARVLYEYDRLGTNAYQINTLQNTQCFIYGTNEHNNYRNRMDGYTNAIAEMCGKLSPAAAIIFGQYYAFRYCALGEKEGYIANFIENTILDSSLRDLIADKSRITPEVALFFVKEAELFEQRLAGSFKFFSRKDQLIKSSESECRGDTDVPVPCECAESFYPCVLGKYSVGLS